MADIASIAIGLTTEQRITLLELAAETWPSTFNFSLHNLVDLGMAKINYITFECADVTITPLGLQVLEI